MISELQVADTIAEAVYYHRENYDGGYLAGKCGNEIPVLAQILAVADLCGPPSTLGREYGNGERQDKGAGKYKV